VFTQVSTVLGWHVGWYEPGSVEQPQGKVVPQALVVSVGHILLLGRWGEEARGFFVGRSVAKYRASCLSSTESALSTSASLSKSSLAPASDVDTVLMYTRGDTCSLPFREARGGWIVAAVRSLLIVGLFSSSGTVITRSMTLGSELAGVGVASIIVVFTGGLPLCVAIAGIRLEVSARISPLNFFNAS
jgi:hypothetical protein